MTMSDPGRNWETTLNIHIAHRIVIGKATPDDTPHTKQLF